jgi:hypothetical protein
MLSAHNQPFFEARNFQTPSYALRKKKIKWKTQRIPASQCPQYKQLKAHSAEVTESRLVGLLENPEAATKSAGDNGSNPLIGEPYHFQA